MPLPRFDRLPVDRQRRILDVATIGLARDGIETASYNQILAEASVPKASAYHYFDGRADLVRTVLQDIAGQLVAVLGRWEHQDSAADFRAAIAGGAERLTAHLVANQDHLALAPAVLGLTADLPGPRAWVEAAVDNGIAIGMIRTDVPRDLMAETTLAVLQAIDAWAINWIAKAADGDQSVGPVATLALLEGLWNSPTDSGRDQR